VPSRDCSNNADAGSDRTTQTSNQIARTRRQTLDDIPRRSARRFASRTAIIDGDTSLTFAEFDRNGRPSSGSALGHRTDQG